MTALLVVLHSIISVLLVFVVLMHSGKDTGLSGAFGVGATSGAYGGSSAIIEKNLDRVTVVTAIAFFTVTGLLSMRI